MPHPTLKMDVNELSAQPHLGIIYSDGAPGCTSDGQSGMDSLKTPLTLSLVGISTDANEQGTHPNTGVCFRVTASRSASEATVQLLPPDIQEEAVAPAARLQL